MDSYTNNIGAYALPKTGLAPIATDAAAKGTGIDRTNYRSAVLSVLVGAATGAPDSFSVNGKLQHSAADVDGDYVDLTDADGNVVAVTQLTAAGESHVNVDLAGANAFVRAVVTPALTGGTTPKALIAATIVFGGAPELPIA